MKSPGVQNKFRPSIIFRLADLYFLYAEAVNEIDPQDERVLTYLNKVRQRAGLSNIEELNPAIEGNQELQRLAIQRERRIELATEGQRYFDVRRWMIAPTTNSKELCGMLVYATLKSGKTAAAPYVHDETVWDYHYYVQSLSYREDRKWDNKMYFAPISRDEVNRNTQLVQNPGME